MALLVFSGPMPSRACGQDANRDKRMILSVLPKYGVARGHAPIPLSVSLTWRMPELIEGHLQLDWFVNTTRLGQYVSPELALADSKINLTVLLPPIMLSDDTAIVSVQGRFLGDEEVFDLDVHDLAVQPDWRRILLVANCGPPRKMPPQFNPEASFQRHQTRHPFDLEPFFEKRFTKRELLVDETDLPPADVPEDPLEFTAFDLFVIQGESFSKLKPRQLEALSSWVRAGGSLCLFVDSGVPRSHISWLNGLIGTDVADAAYLQGEDGELIATEEADAGVHRHVVEFGRAVVAFVEPEVESDAWREAALFLWKVRASRRQAALHDRPWILGDKEFRGSFDRYVPLEPVRSWHHADLPRFLLPDSIRGLPLVVVGTVLALFLVVIAPGDYYLLGALRRRRWTWVLFPAVSLLFTAGTMWLARQHLGQTTYDQSITVVDLSADGQPLRTSRFDLLFAPSNRRAAAERQQALMVPFDPMTPTYSYNFTPPMGPEEYEQPWIYIGRVPQNYVVYRDIQQWSPRLARVTAIGTWPDLDTSELARVSALLASLTISSDDQMTPRKTSVNTTPTQVLRFRGNDTATLQTDNRLPSFIQQLATHATRRPDFKYFSVVSQLSPTAAGNWEDLTLLDASDPRQSVTVAVTNPAAGQFVIYRRLEWEID